MKRSSAAAFLVVALSVVVARADNPLSVTAGGVPITGTAPITVTAGVVACTDASASVGGCMTAGTQSIAGAKTFTSIITDAGGFAGFPGTIAGGHMSSADLASVNDGTTRFSMVSGNRTDIQGNATNGSTAVGNSFGNVNDLTTAGAKVARFCRGTAATCTNELSAIDQVGSYVMTSASRVTCTSCNVAIQGQVSAGGATESVTVGTLNILTSTTGKIMAFMNDDIGNSPTSVSYIQKDGKYNMAASDTSGSPATSSTMNKPSGKIALSAGNSVYTLTNNVVQTATIPVVTVLTNDTTCWLKSVVVTANTLTITMVAACTADTSLGFVLHN